MGMYSPCTECGTDIHFTGKFCPNCGTANPNHTFCPKCRVSFEAHEHFCSFCGVALKVGKKESKDGDNGGNKEKYNGQCIGKKKNDTHWGCGCLVFIIILVIVGLLDC